MANMNIEKTGELMNEEQYWSMVENSLKQTQNQHQQGQFLISELKKLSPHDMIGFALRTQHLLDETYTSEMWCANNIMNKIAGNYRSDDGFENFRSWVISRGKEAYYKAKANPDHLVNEVVEGYGKFDYEFELFGFAAHTAFEEITEENIWDYIQNKDPETPLPVFTPIKFNWLPGDPESMKKICPRLYDAFN